MAHLQQLASQARYGTSDSASPALQNVTDGLISHQRKDRIKMGGGYGTGAWGKSPCSIAGLL